MKYFIDAHSIQLIGVMAEFNYVIANFPPAGSVLERGVEVSNLLQPFPFAVLLVFPLIVWYAGIRYIHLKDHCAVYFFP